MRASFFNVEPPPIRQLKRLNKGVYERNGRVSEHSETIPGFPILCVVSRPYAGNYLPRLGRSARICCANSLMPRTNSGVEPCVIGAGVNVTINISKDNTAMLVR